jgi:hypothetical protein
MRAESFDLTDVPSSQRAADALMRFIDGRTLSKPPQGLAA